MSRSKQEQCLIANLFSSQIVIELDGNNEKAWYRRGQACIKQKDFDRAKTSFMKVASISGGQYKCPESRVVMA